MLRENENINTVRNDDNIIGDFELIHDFYSTILKNERDITIWLPPTYHCSDKKYPVLYLNDGQNLFNPFTSFTGYDWKVDETASFLIEKKIVKEFIVVGINNTRDRIQEYNLYNPKGVNYIKFLINELKPFLDENYRTLSDSKNTGIGGSSMGGLISFQTYFEHSSVFGMAICMSNSFWFNNREIFNFIKNYKKVKNTKLYIDCGELEKELIDDNKEMCEILANLEYTPDELGYYFDPTGRHSEFDWAKRFHIPLKFLFGT